MHDYKKQNKQKKTTSNEKSEICLLIKVFIDFGTQHIL